MALQRAKYVVGMSVRTPGGERLGEVSDVLLDPATRKLVGLAISSGAILRRPRYVRRPDIVDIDTEGILIKSADHILTEPIGGQGLNSASSPVGLTVERPGVGDVGHVRDVLLDPHRLTVWGFEISDGLVNDVLNGISRLPRRNTKQIPGRLIWEPSSDDDHMNDEGDGNPSLGGGERQ